MWPSVESLNSLFIKNFNSSSIKTSRSVVSEMERLASNCLLSDRRPQVVTLPTDGWIKVGHLNVHSYVSKEL